MSSVESLEMQLRDEIKEKLELGMARGGFKTQREAAANLRMEPATLNVYLMKKATPSAFFLLTVCKAWNLRIEFDGIEFGAKKISAKQKATRKTPEQLPLFSVLKELENHDLDVTIGKKSLDRLELNVQIRFAS